MDARETKRPRKPEIGLVDGSVPASTRRFHVVLDDKAFVQLDDLVACSQPLPEGGAVTHYGIVVEGTGQIEGAELPTDTQRIATERTMPGVTVRRVEVQVLRTTPELWLPPLPGAVVRRVSPGPERDAALFIDQMQRPLPIGVDQSGDSVLADFSFINGEKGGHVSISGVSGVATKTSYALFLLYMLFETAEGRRLLGPHGPNTHALVFNVKGEDLLHIDRPNNKYKTPSDAADQWRSLGVESPGKFGSVALYAPRAAGSHEGAVATDVTSRSAKDVIAFGWPPRDFIREGLLRFCFAEEEDSRTQVSFVEQKVRTQLARWAYPLENEPGAVVLCDPPDTTSQVFQRVISEMRDPRPAGAGHPVRSFHDLMEFLDRKLSPDTPTFDPRWTAGVQQGTCLAFLRRLYAQSPRLGHLVTVGVEPVVLQKSITVVDIHALHDGAQRFVVGALLSRIFEEKQGKGREPLRFIVLDELNKYAPKQGTSPIKEVLVDIAARGRSLGVLLIGAQQSAADVDANITRNAALKIVGRLDAGEAADYKFLTAELRERASRFLPGTMVVDQPLIPAPLPLRFPFPAFATCVAEGEGSRRRRRPPARRRLKGSDPMKLLHVSDWHLGRTTYNASRAEDHDKVLAEILDLARHERPDLILHTGDLFESIRPAYEDMDRGIRALLLLADVAPVVVLCGNHDSPALFRLFAKLLGDDSRIRFVDKARAADDGGVIVYPGPRGETIRLACLPFVHANRMVPAFEKPDTWMVAYADRIKLIQENLWEGLSESANYATDVLVFAAHLHVAGATFSRSERPIHVTDTYASRIEHIPKASYAAFGHIHKPQALPQNEKGWYAGSPIPLDFGEVGEQKYAILVEAEPQRPPHIRPVPLSGGRPLKRLAGSLVDIARLAPNVGKSLCLVTVETETPVPDLSEKVRDLLVDAVILQVEESCAAKKTVALKKEDAQTVEPTFEELFREYLGETGTKGATVDRVLSTFASLLAAVEHEEKPGFPEEKLLDELAEGGPRIDGDPARSPPVASTPVASTPVASTPVASTPVASTPVATAPDASAFALTAPPTEKPGPRRTRKGGAS